MTASWTIRAPRTAGILASAALALAVAACGSSHKAAPKHANADGATQRPALPWDPGPAPELRNAPATAAIALVGGTVWTAAGQIIPNGLVVARNGVLEYVGPGSDAAIPDDAQVFDVRGRHVTPGLIDTHSHMG
ncbi:MAG: hypothetical protein KC417_16855, partial [Myxococcales bacterium]|nr:hypothetical protein [Myxococcales bacterium]